MKKILIIFIVILILFSACGGNNGSSNETKSTPDTTTAIETEEIRENLPNINFDDYEFKILMEELHPSYTPEVYVTEMTGERVNDALYMRDRVVEERFGVKISYVVVTGEGQGTTRAYNAIAAGENAFDVMKVTPRSAQKIYGKNFTADWQEIPWIDLDKPWWNQNIRDQLSIGGRVTWMSSNASILDYATIRALVFNKGLFTDMGLDSPYPLVSNGTWTMSAMERYMKDMPQDLNGDGVINVDEDRYGIIIAGGVIDEITFTWGSRIISKDEDDLPYLVLYSNRTIDIVAKLYEWIYDREYVFARSNWSDRPTWFKSFGENRTLFMFDGLGQLILLRDSDVDFGILPFPKWDESQEKYMNNAHRASPQFAIPATAPKLERTGIIFEAMSAEGYRMVIPEYYEIALKVRDTRDNESEKSIDLLYEGLVYDIAEFFNISFSNLITNLVLNEKSNYFVSYYEKHETAALAALDKFVDLVLEE
ncbi:MAG: hypothetical protein FWF15_04380 [Oscillospiraceae bacterium]|nr:hypothetical protein [Oscillospiraceae bacterium]